MKVGDAITVKGMPARVLGLSSNGKAMMYLALILTRSIPWVPLSLIQDPAPTPPPGTPPARPLKVGDPVTVQGAPGTVAEMNTDGETHQALVVVETPSIQWLTADQIDPPASGSPARPPSAPFVPGPVKR